jgi:effector-binding domain-containing protein
MNPIARYMGLMFDSWIGKDYDAGIANLKRVVEAQAVAATNAALADPGDGNEPPALPLSAVADPTKGPEIVTIESRDVLMIRASAKAVDDAAISAALGASFQKIITFAETNGLEISGAPLAITISHSASDNWVFDAAMPLSAKPDPSIAEADGTKVGKTYEGRALKITHKGPYTTIKDAYATLHAYAKTKNLKEKSTSWEEYVGDPTETQDEELLTNVYIAIE